MNVQAKLINISFILYAGSVIIGYAILILTATSVLVNIAYNEISISAIYHPKNTEF